MRTVKIAQHCSQRPAHVSQMMQRKQMRPRMRTGSEEKGLLDVLLAEVRDVGLDNVEELGADGGDASEELGTDGALPDRDRPPSVLALCT